MQCLMSLKAILGDMDRITVLSRKLIPVLKAAKCENRAYVRLLVCLANSISYQIGTLQKIF